MHGYESIALENIIKGLSQKKSFMCIREFMFQKYFPISRRVMLKK